MSQQRSQVGFVMSSLRRWRRVLLALLTVGAIALWGSLALSQRPTHVAVLIQALEGAQWAPIVKAFEEQNPDVKLDLVEGPNATNLVEDLYTSSFLLGDSPYDLAYMDIVWVQKFAAAGWLRDLSDRISAEELAGFLDTDVEGGRYRDGLYRLPVRSDAGMLYYRTDLLEQLGAEPPETVEDLVHLSKEAQEQDLARWGYLWQGKQYEGTSAMFVEILEGFGGFWVNPDTLEVGLDRPEAIQAVEFLRQTIEDGISPSGVTTYQEEEARRLFRSGDALLMRSWPYAWPLNSTEDSPIRGKFGIKPMVHAPGQRSGACQGGWGFGITTSSRHPDEAWRVVEFFASPESQKTLILENGYLPTRPELYSDPEVVAKYPYYPALLSVVQTTVLRPPIAQYAQASDILQRYLSAAFTGRNTPEDAMRAAAAETRSLLGRA